MAGSNSSDRLQQLETIEQQIFTALQHGGDYNPVLMLMLTIHSLMFV